MPRHAVSAKANTGTIEQGTMDAKMVPYAMRPEKFKYYLFDLLLN